jgi:hypothetical protein
MERMAMIEKGIAPPALMESAGINGRDARKQRSSGVFMICLGIGLAMMMGLSMGSWRNVWIGGFIAMFGVATLVNALLDERDRRKTQSAAPQITSSPDH